MTLDSNPLDDIRASRDIHAVIFSGKVYDRAQLDAMLEQAAQRKAVLDAQHH